MRPSCSGLGCFKIPSALARSADELSGHRNCWPTSSRVWRCHADAERCGAASSRGSVTASPRWVFRAGWMDRAIDRSEPAQRRAISDGAAETSDRNQDTLEHPKYAGERPDCVVECVRSGEEQNSSQDRARLPEVDQPNLRSMSCGSLRSRGTLKQKGVQHRQRNWACLDLVNTRTVAADKLETARQTRC